MSDCILIEGIRLKPRIGTTARERASRPPCSVDIRIDCDLSAGSSTDRLDETIDYYGIFEEVREVARLREYTLLESLAGEIATRILKRQAVRGVSVTARKLGKSGLQSFGVQIDRRRNAQRGRAAAKTGDGPTRPD